MEPGEKPELTLEKLQSAIPEYDWAKGHSGALLPDDVADKFIELYNEKKNFRLCELPSTKAEVF